MLNCVVMGSPLLDYDMFTVHFQQVTYSVGYTTAPTRYPGTHPPGTHPPVPTPSMEERQDRHIPHNMPDYESFIAQLKLSSSQVSLPAGTGDASITFDSSSSHHKLKEETKDWILQNVALVMSKIPQGGQYSPTSLKGKEKQDSSIYVGTGGNAYLHWKLTRFFQAEGEKEKADFHRQSAVSAINVSLGLLPRKVAMGRGISFYIGSAGVLKNNW